MASSRQSSGRVGGLSNPFGEPAEESRGGWFESSLPGSFAEPGSHGGSELVIDLTDQELAAQELADQNGTDRDGLRPEVESSPDRSPDRSSHDASVEPTPYAPRSPYEAPPEMTAPVAVQPSPVIDPAADTRQHDLSHFMAGRPTDLHQARGADPSQYLSVDREVSAPPVQPLPRVESFAPLGVSAPPTRATPLAPSMTPHDTQRVALGSDLPSVPAPPPVVPPEPAPARLLGGGLPPQGYSDGWTVMAQPQRRNTGRLAMIAACVAASIGVASAVAISSLNDSTPFSVELGTSDQSGGSSLAGADDEAEPPAASPGTSESPNGAAGALATPSTEAKSEVRQNTDRQTRPAPVRNVPLAPAPTPGAKTTPKVTKSAAPAQVSPPATKSPTKTPTPTPTAKASTSPTPVASPKPEPSVKPKPKPPVEPEPPVEPPVEPDPPVEDPAPDNGGDAVPPGDTAAGN